MHGFFIKVKEIFSIESCVGLLISLIYIFVLTFIVFPGVSGHTYFTFIDSGSWFFLTMIIIFNVADTVGRYCGGKPAFNIHSRSVVIGTAVRTIFAATFLLTGFEVGPSWLFNSDWFKMTNMVLFALTNGYFSTLCAVKAPQAVHVEERSKVGSFIGIGISSGIVLGSIFAIPMGFVVKEMPPTPY